MTPPAAGPRPTLRQAVLVAVGGTVGAGVRELLALALPGHPTILGINLLGSFLIGMLLESLGLIGPDEGRRRDLRLLLGTGLLGGFTTYSAFAVDALDLLATDPPIALGYLAVSLVGGVGLAWAGVRCAATVLRSRTGGGR